MEVGVFGMFESSYIFMLFVRGSGWYYVLNLLLSVFVVL